MDIIDPKDFIKQVLQESALSFVYHLIMIKICQLKRHPACIAQVLTATPQLIILPESYKDFENIFSAEIAGHLLPKDHDHFINLVDANQRFY